ncbi:MAG: hypothetical protein DSY91_06320 [Deltaproteobacteria bacterium]|nr:MAG: hypothetical protein DSY91_06320 [Deltaproteobacteria bacterium]
MNFEGKGAIIIGGCFLGLLLFFSGCAGKQKPRVSITEESLPRVCRVAVLPFQNQTKTTAAGLMLYRILMAEMARLRNFQVVEEGAVRRILLRGKVYPGQSITPEIREMIMKTLHPDALLSGEVVDVEETSDMVRLAFNLRMRDARTGQLLWTTYYARTGEEYRKVMHFGEIDTLAGLTRQMVFDVLKMWQEKKLGGCSR